MKTSPTKAEVGSASFFGGGQARQGSLRKPRWRGRAILCSRAHQPLTRTSDGPHSPRGHAICLGTSHVTHFAAP